MSVLSEESAGASVAADADPLSIAAVTSRVEYTGQLEPDNPGQTRHDNNLETQWIRQLVACYPAELPVSLAHPITPDTLIPVMYWSTLSTYQNGTEHVDLVPLWMLASGEKAFLRAYLSTPPDDAELATAIRRPPRDRSTTRSSLGTKSAAAITGCASCRRSWSPRPTSKRQSARSPMPLPPMKRTLLRLPPPDRRVFGLVLHRASYPSRCSATKGWFSDVSRRWFVAGEHSAR